jgi:hypothetical protein
MRTATLYPTGRIPVSIYKITNLFTTAAWHKA